MIKLTLKANETDKEMIELIGEGLNGYKLLWAVIHNDLIYEDEDLRYALENGEELQMKLVKL